MPPDQDKRNHLLSMQHICKAFDRIRVLDDVPFILESGEVHVLAGENGAGKSTLIKILGGVYQSFSGTIELNGKPVRIKSPHDAARHGIAVIHQEMSLVESLSVLDNLFLGREECYAGAWLSHKHQVARARAMLESLGMSVDIHSPVESLPVSMRQMIEIAKALLLDARVVVFDEPTSALNEPEAEKLFRVIGTLKDRNCGIIYITHKMEEIFRIGDRITVLRDGKYINSSPVGPLSAETLVEWMVGRTVTQQYPARNVKAGETCLTVTGLSFTIPGSTASSARTPVSFSVRSGEIVGFAGLQGSGNSNLFNCLFGAGGGSMQGTVAIHSEPVRIRSPREAIRHGMALLTNDRAATGIIPDMSVNRNITLASLKSVSSFGWVRKKKETVHAAGLIRQLHVRLQSGRQEIRTLSGGNQQKAVLAKWLMTNPGILLLDEPTRGVDVGAKHEIYVLMNQLTEQGIAILLITSEMPELLAMSDRILVMHRGEIIRELSGSEATQEQVLQAAMGSMNTHGTSRPETN
jgi:ABC-type sugar transport system ATPase subunit